jgi:hypothetical protein
MTCSCSGVLAARIPREEEEIVLSVILAVNLERMKGYYVRVHLMIITPCTVHWVLVISIFTVNETP